MVRLVGVTHPDNRSRRLHLRLLRQVRVSNPLNNADQMAQFQSPATFRWLMVGIQLPPKRQPHPRPIRKSKILTAFIQVGR